LFIEQSSDLLAKKIEYSEANVSGMRDVIIDPGDRVEGVGEVLCQAVVGWQRGLVFDCECTSNNYLYFR
jgi:hypothetical protein